MKTLFLRPNHFAILDDEDFDAVNAIGNFTYCAGYSCHWYTDASGKRRRLWLQRIVMERMLGHTIPAGMQVDHISGGQIGMKARLDNRRENLRLASRSEQQANKGPQKNSTSGCKGITLRAGRYDVRLRHGEGQRLYLGRYDTLYTALTVYGLAHRLVWGEFTTEALVPEPTPELQAYVLSRLIGQGVQMNNIPIQRPN